FEQFVVAELALRRIAEIQFQRLGRQQGKVTAFGQRLLVGAGERELRDQRHIDIAADETAAFVIERDRRMRAHGTASPRTASNACCSAARSSAELTVSTSSSAASSRKRWRKRLSATTIVSGRHFRRVATISYSPGAGSRARNGSSIAYMSPWPVWLA